MIRTGFHTRKAAMTTHGDDLAPLTLSVIVPCFNEG